MNQMNTFNFTQLSLILLLTVSTFAFGNQAANTSLASQPYSQQIIEGQNLLDQYVANQNSPQRKNSLSNNTETLEIIHSKGLPKTAKNVVTLRTLLASNALDNEKIMLVRLLGKLYANDNQSGMNHLIVQDLKLQTNSNQNDIARSAVLAFSRLGFFVDSSAILKRAYDRKLLDADGYYGELAHLLPYASAAEQNNLLDMIKNGNNFYAREILASSFTDSEIIKKLSPKTKKNLHLFFEKNQPNFSQAIGEYDAIESFHYTNWLLSISKLEIEITNKTYQEVTFTRLNDSNLDARKIMAYLSSTSGRYLIEHLQNDAQKNDLKLLLE